MLYIGLKRKHDILALRARPELLVEGVFGVAATSDPVIAATAAGPDGCIIALAEPDSPRCEMSAQMIEDLHDMLSSLDAEDAAEQGRYFVDGIFKLGYRRIRIIEDDGSDTTQMILDPKDLAVLDVIEPEDPGAATQLLH